MKDPTKLAECVGKTVKAVESTSEGLLVAFEDGDFALLIAEDYCVNCDHVATIVPYDRLDRYQLRDWCDIEAFHRLGVISDAERDERSTEERQRRAKRVEEERARKLSDYLRLKAEFEPAPLPEGETPTTPRG